MSHELRNCEMEMRQAIQNMKLDHKNFRDDVEKSLDSAAQFLSNHLKGIRLLTRRDHYDEAIEELENTQFKPL